MQICSVRFNTTSFVPTLSFIVQILLVLCDCDIFKQICAPNCKDENTIKMLKFKYMLLYFSTVGLFICLFVFSRNNDI